MIHVNTLRRKTCHPQYFKRLRSPSEIKNRGKKCIYTVRCVRARTYVRTRGTHETQKRVARHSLANWCFFHPSENKPGPRCVIYQRHRLDEQNINPCRRDPNLNRIHGPRISGNSISRVFPEILLGINFLPGTAHSIWPQSLAGRRGARFNFTQKRIFVSNYTCLSTGIAESIFPARTYLP